MTPLKGGGEREIWPGSSLVVFQSYVFNINAEKAMKYRLGMNPGGNINNLIYADNTMLIVESKKELKNHLMRVEEESEKVSLKLNIQKTKIMASSPVSSWQTDGEKVETVTGFIFLGSKITADGDGSHEIKRRLLLGRKTMTDKLRQILKSKDITLPTKVHLVMLWFSRSQVWM